MGYTRASFRCPEYNSGIIRGVEATEVNDELGSMRAELLEVVRSKALLQFDEPRELSSGEMSRDFVDVKRGLARGADLWLGCAVMARTVVGAGVGFNAVGGLTLGADQFSHGVATYLADDCEWFVVRKKPKGRGTNQLIEGSQLDGSSRVLLVEDAVTTGVRSNRPTSTWSTPEPPWWPRRRWSTGVMKRRDSSRSAGCRTCRCSPTAISRSNRSAGARRPTVRAEALQPLTDLN
ncbi:MAG: hypothetical protein R2789_17780 [Microthrixaceae bacterium]